MDSPFLELLEPSKEKSSAIVLITGYISEGDFDEKAGKKWSQALRQAGWNGSIYKPIPLISKFELEST